MKAMQVVQPRSFVTVQVPIPHLMSGSPDRLLIQTRWASMCGSDIPFFTGNKRFKPYPLAPGAPIHECVGQVVESTSDLFQPGDHVVAIPEGDRGLAEFFVAQTAKAVRLPPDLAGHDASCMIQPLSTVMNAVDRMGNVQGQSAASEYLAKSRDLFLSCREELEILVTHRFSIQDAQKAFTLYERHEDGILKALLDVSCWETNCE